MFEQEIEMEKKSSSVGPLLVIVLLVLVFVGGAGLVIFQSRQTFKPESAAQLLEQTFKARGPVTTEFSTGLIGWNTATEGHYAILEKAGFLNISKPDSQARKTIKLTPKGQTEMAAFPEFKPDVEKDGRTNYKIPLATKKLIEVGKITMNGPNMAVVEYTWKWEPTKMGDLFDASGKELQSLNPYQRATVIEKHGADYYHGGPIKTSVRVIKSPKGWKIAND